MEALNFSNVLISLTKLKMEINQWIEAKQKDIPDVIISSLLLSC